MYNVIMQYLNSCLSYSIRNLTLASFSESFIYKKTDVFPLFTSSNSHSGFFFMKPINENQLDDFLIKHSCKKYCLHNCTLWGITITVDPRIKFDLKKGDCFVKKCQFTEFFFSDHDYFSYHSD